MGKSGFDKLADSVGFASSQHEIVAFTELQNPPHAFDVFRCKAPISLRIQIAEEQFFLQPVFDGCNRARDFASDKRFAASRTFVVEHDGVARTKAVALPIVNSRPICKNLCDSIGTAWPKRCLFRLRLLLRLAKDLAARRLKKTGTQSGFADRL